MKSIDPAQLRASDFGSAFDPVLSGVAHGLAGLFPPIENAPRNRDEETEPSDETEPDERQP